jgi:hypothetical protein
MTTDEDEEPCLREPGPAYRVVAPAGREHRLRRSVRLRPGGLDPQPELVPGDRKRSDCSTFQVRRVGIRYLDGDCKRAFAATLNGSGLPIGRTLVAILEPYQELTGQSGYVKRSCPPRLSCRHGGWLNEIASLQRRRRAGSAFNVGGTKPRAGRGSGGRPEIELVHLTRSLCDKKSEALQQSLHAASTKSKPSCWYAAAALKFRFV